MKRYRPCWFVLFLSFLLSGCMTYYPAAHYQNLTQETWMRYIETNPARWASKADGWFLSGSVTEAEVYNRRAPRSASISFVNVNVADFDSIQVNGAFQVQIYGTNTSRNSLNMIGTNGSVRSISVSVRDHTLYLEQANGAPVNIRNAVVRIGVRHLNSIIQMNCGSIEAVFINSNHFTVNAMAGASGPVFVSGHLNVTRVSNMGDGTINLFGVDSNRTAIVTSGAGTTNLCGNIGISSIYHSGSSNINLIGANSRSLTIYAEGSGKIGIKGRVGLNKLDAQGKVRVYIDTVTSRALRVTLKQEACVGLIGCTNSLNVMAQAKTRFYGRNLCARQSYIKTYSSAYANITAAEKFFAFAADVSTINFYGPRSIMSAFTSSYGNVTYIANADFRLCYAQ